MDRSFIVRLSKHSGSTHISEDNLCYDIGYVEGYLRQSQSRYAQCEKFNLRMSAIRGRLGPYRNSNRRITLDNRPVIGVDSKLE
jgi:hypothetical protein